MIFFETFFATRMFANIPKALLWLANMTVICFCLTYKGKTHSAQIYRSTLFCKCAFRIKEEKRVTNILAHHDLQRANSNSTTLHRRYIFFRCVTFEAKCISGYLSD